jgi:hypothetical protein
MAPKKKDLADVSRGENENGFETIGNQSTKERRRKRMRVTIVLASSGV